MSSAGRTAKRERREASQCVRGSDVRRGRESVVRVEVRKGVRGMVVGGGTGAKGWRSG